ncbi:MAG: tRNA uridine-5-carboxymethylaminomethyl(34) synthesis enzyme MnmG [Clostridia bacterium]|nr:tRNA uridine-5-carboxymethylaminomethyl(34) synthesis enzyme MnmG [Clostridia bacterium]
MEYVAGKYDAIVIGAGHAGCEAALSLARLQKKTILFTLNNDFIANMPCNPSIGGTAKGHLVREIDALGGQMGKSADQTLIQSKMLNLAKGPAVYSLRAQIDRRKYQQELKHILEKQENLEVRQAEVTDILFENNKVCGVKTNTNAIYECKCAIICTGTYLKGRIIIGEISYEGGPDGLFPANRLSESLKSIGVEIMRFKTGTPSRVNKRSLDFSKMEEQKGDTPIVPFSFETEKIDINQISCYLTYTNEKTHQIINENLHRSPLFSGDIKGTGPRYCPSIEDKVVRFKDKERHQLFIEPMGLDTEEMYVQGMSSSLPEEVQDKMLKSVKGLENVSVMRSAYAIEYDCFDPLQLKKTLEFKNFEGLYSAGQSNGSSGYEEAAAQGLMAGINASLKLDHKEPLILDRSEAYIGVLIDDLVTKGTNEPYRMMTSRSEYRLLLRQDNADMRLTEYGYQLGLISQERYDRFNEKMRNIEEQLIRLKKTVVSPKKANQFLAKYGSTEVISGITLDALLKRPEITYQSLKEIDEDHVALDLFTEEEIEISSKYEGYMERQKKQVKQYKKLENYLLPEETDYSALQGISMEARQKLQKIRPVSLGQASRISGVSPADINVLLIHLDQKKRENR